MTHPQGTEGTREAYGLMLDYFLSPNTDLYLAADRASLKGAWLDVAAAPSYADYSGGEGRFFPDYPDRARFTIGLRHKF
jgi:predicted porin